MQQNPPFYWAEIMKHKFPNVCCPWGQVRQTPNGDDDMRNQATPVDELSTFPFTKERKRERTSTNKNKTEAFFPDSELVKMESQPVGRKARTCLCSTWKDTHQISILSPRSQQTRSCK